MGDSSIFLIQSEFPRTTHLAAVLEAPGRTLIPLHTGAQALARMEREAPDLVVLDADLPGEDGCVLCARLRLAALEADLPVIVCTGRPGGEGRARRAGADAVLAQPVEPQDLAALVRNMLDRRALRDRGARSRLDALPVLGCVGQAPTSGGADGGGAFAPANLPRLLLSWFEARVSGLVEIEADDRVARIAFSHGHPTSVAMHSPETGLGRLLVECGQLTLAQVEQVARVSLRQGVPLGRLLVLHDLVDPISLDHALQLQTLRRLAAILRFPAGRWRAGDRLAHPGAGFPTHAAAALWHLADIQVPVPALGAAELEQYIVASEDLAAIWHLFDPRGRAAGLRLVLLGGGRPVDARELAGERVLPLVALLKHTGVLRLTADPPDPARRASVLARSDIEPFREQLEASWAVACGADACTVLGVPASVTPAEAAEAAARLLERYRPETLPPGLSLRERARATELHRQALAARRALTHPRRRVAHDFLMQAVESSPPLGAEAQDHAIFHAEHARGLYRRGEYVGAAAKFALAVQLEGETPDLLAMLGQARHRAAPSDPAAGEPELRRALRRDPGHALAHLYLGRLLAVRGDLSEAREHLARAHVLAPELPAVQEALRHLDVPPATGSGPEGSTSRST